MLPMQKIWNDYRLENLIQLLDITQNTLLNRLNVRGTGQLTSGVLDISNNPLLTRIEADATVLATLDISNNPLLTDVRVYTAQLPAADLDQLVNDLDGFGVSNGNLEIETMMEGLLQRHSQPIIIYWQRDGQ